MRSVLTRTEGMALCGLFALMAHGVTAVGCGGKAVVDPPALGTGGSTTSSSGTGGTTSSTSTSTSTSTSGTGGGPGSLCDEACSTIDACLSNTMDCSDSCKDAMDGCVSDQDAYLMCVIDQVNSQSCGPSSLCSADLWSFLDCKNVQDVAGGCGMSPNGDCECMLEDNLGNRYESNCATSGNSNKCECSFNMEPVGQCGFQGPPECDPFNNCCGTLFFVTGLSVPG
jgi:hypothetical protein